QRHLERSEHRLRAVLVNAGNANCATGEAGVAAAQECCAKAGAVFDCDPHAVFPSSTGIIGVLLPVEKLAEALPALHTGLGSSAAHLQQMANAIMTTDTRPKAAAATFVADGVSVRIAGIAKGAGMIHPQLQSAAQAPPHATMLVYLFTDAELEPTVASDLLHHAVESSFNRISIDGDTSTNDTVLLLASGASGISIRGHSHDTARTVADQRTTAFSAALDTVCLSLAKQIVDDGEGVQHVVELVVGGALTDTDALRIARSIAHSPLVKTAWAGCDPNWGRILAAIGYAGVAIDPARINISFGDLEICHNGGLSPRFNEAAAHAYLKQRNLTILVDLGVGPGTCRFWTTDLTTEYIRINADYST
ncbi:MAG TPA: bifunctional glutamate N-acetyltransferase/amino-acid acetyltransferase ArgJ, partial [Acidobacteriaceae bacterium]|nr:bifunctional glutamate N-acetyltransferase/amino-acid acetyltransferase ArgJ [Acidobacteriaceae bacterium]